MAGSSGMAGNGGTASAPAPGEYDLIPKVCILNFPSVCKGPPLHLSLPASGPATVSLAFETSDTEPYVFDPTKTFTPPAFPDGTFSPQGPLFIDAALSEEADQISKLAFSLDAAGVPTKATVLGTLKDPTGACTMISVPPRYSAGYDVVADTTPPSLKGRSNALPWRDGFPLSEPILLPTGATANGATLVSFSANGMSLLPVYTEDFFALLGKSVAFSFPALADLAGNSAPAYATIQYASVGPAVAQRTFATGGDCTGVSPFDSPLVLRLHAVGATSAQLKLCRVDGGPTQATMVANATSVTGVTTTTMVAVSDGTTIVDLPLPADDVVLEVAFGPCWPLTLDAVTMM